MINATGTRLTMEINRLSGLSRALSDTQISISTGRKFQKASEAPVAAARVATLRRDQMNSAAWASNISIGVTLTAQADAVLNVMADRMARASELMVAGANGSLSQADRDSYALELRGIATEIASYASERTSLGQPLFTTGQPLGLRVTGDLVINPLPDQASVFAPGGVPLEQTLLDAATALETGNASAIQSGLGAIQDAVSHVADVRIRIGSTAARLETLQEQRAAREIEISAERSSLEDTDLSEAIARLNAQAITLEAAQAAFARINRQSLFDLLG